MQLLNLTDVSTLLQRCPKNARVWLVENNVPSIPVGKSFRWSLDDILSAIERGKIKPLAKEFAPRKARRPLPITGRSNRDVMQALGI